MPASLVTGGAGFIGSHVAEQLVKNGHEVFVLDDLSGGFIDNIPKGTKFVNGSILDVELIDRLFREHTFTFVYHLAAYAAEGLSHFIKRFNYNNNLMGSVNLINACVNYEVACIVFSSSIAVYGTGQTPMKEEIVPVPEDPYGIAKLAVEQDLKVSHEMFGLDYIIFRPHNVYGERQNIGDRYRNVVGIFMNQILRGEPMTIFGDGTQVRAFTHISDVAPMIASAVDVPGARNEIFNIGADMFYNVNDLAAIVADAMEAECTTVHLDARNEVKAAFSDHSKVHRVFGKKTNVPLPVGLRAMAKWVRSRGACESSVFEQIEVTKNMPPSWRRVARKAMFSD
jgi:UDP-glucose 4-epimerase